MPITVPEGLPAAQALEKENIFCMDRSRAVHQDIRPIRILYPAHPVLRGFDDYFWAPHSRYTEVRKRDIDRAGDLETLAVSRRAGVFLVANRNGRQFFLTGHFEYDRTTLAKEYARDVKKGLPVKIPENYFRGDDPGKSPIMKWRSHASLLFSNWLNYFVYQRTPYDLSNLSGPEG